MGPLCCQLESRAEVRCSFVTTTVLEESPIENFNTNWQLKFYYKLSSDIIVNDYTTKYIQKLCFFIFN